MLWLRKRAEAPARSAAEIVPAALPLALDSRLFAQHFAQLHETVASQGGMEPSLERLTAKQRLFAVTLAGAREQEIDAEALARLLGYVFTARRHLLPALDRLGSQHCTRLMRDLSDTRVAPVQRLQNFVDAMPGAQTPDRADVRAAARLRRAAWDFAAEVVHYADPVRFPLMSRWVWDSSTQSGALREFVRGNDTMRELPFDNSAELFEGARQWLSGCIAEHGIYRDVPLWIDFVLGQAYTSYLCSMANGSLGGEFGRGAEPHEHLSKLLGVDAEEGRLRKSVMSDK
jgi:hypothetical protein